MSSTWAFRCASGAVAITIAGVLSLCGCGEGNERAALRDRTFLLESARGFTPVPGTTVQVSFPGDQLSFRAGCNSHSGTFELDGDTLELTGFGATEIGCEARLHQQDEQLSTFFTSRPKLDLDGNRLTFATPEITLIFLDREVADPDRPLVGPTWSVDTFIANAGATNLGGLTSDPTLLFGDDGSVRVDTTCNAATGEFAVDGDAIELSGMAYTEVACSGASQEADQRMQAVMRDGRVQFTIESARLTIKRGDTGLAAGAQ